MGDYVFERFLIGSIIFILLILGMVFVGIKRKILIGLAIVFLVGYGVFFVIREQVFENGYKQSVEIVNEYLETKYPNEEWNVVDRLEEGQMRERYKVNIIFLNEDKVIYTYKIIDNNKVVQWEISLGGKNIDDSLYNENKIE